LANTKLNYVIYDKMEKKFNLSEKITDDELVIAVDYIKEFIKINLEDLEKVNDTGYGIIGFTERFKKRAGDTLT